MAADPVLPKSFRVCFTGHRTRDINAGSWSEETPEVAFVKAELARAVRLLAARGATEFRSGMALGVDTWGAEAVLSAGLSLVGVVPFRGQERLWPSQAQARYHGLLARCSSVAVVSEAASLDAFKARNCAMVDASEVVVAVWRSDKTFGGTVHCVQYAQSKGHPVLRIDPVRRTVAWM